MICFDFEDNHYLVCVDYYSDYFELDRICDKKGKEVISKLKSQFARHGIPEVLLPNDCLVGGVEHCCQLLQDYLFRKQFRVSRTS